MTPFTWNADREILTPTQFRSVIGGRWRNYIKRGYVWQPISPLVAGDLSCTTFPGNVQFASDSQGWSDIVIDGTFSMTRHIAERNGHNAEPELRLSMQVECDHNVAGHVDEDRPWQVVYRGAWDCADLRLGIWQGKAARIEEVFDIHSMPDGDSEFVEYSFNIRSSHARVFAGPNLDTSPWDGRHAELFEAQAFVARSDSELRGVLLKTPVAWYYTADGTEVRTPIRVTFEIQDDGETVRCTKHIPRALIAEALANGSHLKADATFSPDASPETSSVDGYTGNSNVYGSWSVLMAASATSTLDSGTTLLQTIRDGGADVYRDFYRPITLFDTSSIGVDQVVTAATQEMTISFVNAGTSWDGINLNVYGISPASNTAIVTADHLTMTRTPLDAGVQWGGLRTTGSGAVASFVFDATGRATVNTTGISKYAIGWAYEASDTTPAIDMSGTTGPLWHSAEAGGTANDPILTVTHSAASSFGAWYAAANPSGY
jgi:hypothetical protein